MATSLSSPMRPLHDAAYGLILSEAISLPDDDFQLTRWIKKQISRKSSPLYKWSRNEVREAVDRNRKAAEGPPLL
eukprot:3448998-Amphidinium_carterae.1